MNTKSFLLMYIIFLSLHLKKEGKHYVKDFFETPSHTQFKESIFISISV